MKHSLRLHDIASQSRMLKLVLAVQKGISVESDVSVVYALSDKSNIYKVINISMRKPYLSSESIADPLTRHGRRHQRDNVANATRQLEHDDD